MSRTLYIAFCLDVAAASMNSCVMPANLPNATPRRLSTPKETSHVVRIGYRDWLSQQLAAELLKLALETAGYAVVLVDMVGRSSSKAWECDLSHDKCSTGDSQWMIDVDPEYWRFQEDVEEYRQQVLESQRIFDAGGIGYVGHSGLFFSPASLRNLHPKLLVHVAAAHAVLPETRDLFPPVFSTTEPLDIDWANDYPLWMQRGKVDEESSLWVPPLCEKPGANCGEIYHVSPSWDSGAIESLVLTHEMPYKIHYLGGSASSMIRDSYLASKGNDPVMHYWFTPDPLLQIVSSSRIVFPPYIPGCAGTEPISYRACDFPYTKLAKAASANMRWNAPSAYLTLQRFYISDKELESLMGQHVSGGGNLTSVKDIACNFMRENADMLASWSAGCEKGFVLDVFMLKCIPNCAHGAEVVGNDCRECPLGKHQPIKWTPCVNCTSGHYSDTRGAIKCHACGLGRAARQDGSAGCDACPRGTVSSQVAAPLCTSCMVGRYNEGIGQSACIPCPVGTFSSAVGSTACQPCPGQGFVTGLLGASSEELCVCPPQTYFTGSGCLPCPTGMVCQSTFGVSTPRLLPGYMSFVDRPVDVYKCAWESSCEGERDPYAQPPRSLCTRKHVGTACFLCEEGLAPRGEECALCSGSADEENPLLMLPAEVDVLIGFMLVLWTCACIFNSSMKPPTAERLIWAGLIGFMQALTVLGRFDVSFPGTVKKVFSFGEILEFNTEIVGIRTDCFTGKSFISRLAGRLLWPCFLQAGFVFVLLFFRGAYRCWGGKEPPACIKRCCCLKEKPKDEHHEKLKGVKGVGQKGIKQVKGVGQKLANQKGTKAAKKVAKQHIDRFWPLNNEDMVNCMQKTHFGLFISILSISFSLFNCFQHPNGRWTVKAWPNVECYSEAWVEASPIGVASVLVYCVAFVSWVTYLVIVAPRRVGTDPAFAKRNRFIWGKWHPSKWWFSLCEILFATTLNGICIFVQNAFRQVCLACIVLILYMVVVNNLKPWKFIENTIVDAMMKGTLGFILILATPFVAETTADLETVKQQFSEAMLALPFFPVAIALAFLVKVIWRKYYATTYSHLEKMLIAQRFRDVMALACHMSNREFVRLLTHSLADNDRIQLVGAMDVLIASVLKMQPGPLLKQRRIIPKSPYVIADNDHVHEALVACDIENVPNMNERRLQHRVAYAITAVGEQKVHKEGHHMPKFSKDQFSYTQMKTQMHSLTQVTKNFKQITHSVADRMEQMAGLHFKENFHHLDKDKSGNLNGPEFVQGLMQTIGKHHNLSEEELVMVFDSMDLDGDGTITVDEFCAVLHAAVTSRCHGSMVEDHVHGGIDEHQAPLLEETLVEEIAKDLAGTNLEEASRDDLENNGRDCQGYLTKACDSEFAKSNDSKQDDIELLTHANNGAAGCLADPEQDVVHYGPPITRHENGMVTL